MAQKDGRRENRAAAAKLFNNLAADFSLSAVRVRPTADELTTLYEELCEVASPERLADLKAARALWCEHGGADLDASCLPADAAAAAGAEAVEDGEHPGGAHPLPGHAQLFDATRRAFRLCSRAFMLTFNSLAFAAGPGLGEAFRTWVEECRRAAQERAESGPRAGQECPRVPKRPPRARCASEICEIPKVS